MVLENFDFSMANNIEKIMFGKAPVTSANIRVDAKATGVCGFGVNCSGGGGMCGSSLGCSGGGGRCGFGVNCSGGGGMCGCALGCSGR